MLYSFANRPDAKAELFFDLREGDQDARPAPRRRRRSSASTGSCSTRSSPRTATASSATRCGQEPKASEPAGRHARVAVHGHRTPTRRGSTRRARRSSSPSCRAGTTAATCTSARTACSTSPPATPPTRTRPTRSTPARTSPTCSRRSCASTWTARTPGKNYAVPKDNPFVGHEGRAAGDLGLRLPQPVADELRPRDRRPVGRRRRLGAVGDGLPGREGRQLRLEHHRRAGSRSSRTQKRGPTPIRPPAIELPHTIAASVTGGYVYRGKKFPELRRRLRLRRLGDAPHLGRPLRRRPAQGDAGDRPSRRCASSPSARTTTASCTSSTTTPARSTRSSGTTPPADEPPTSRRSCRETGLFASVKDHTPAAGVFPFEVERPPVAGRRDGGALRRLARARRPSSDYDEPQADPGQRATGTTSGCTSRRTPCW